MSDVSNTISHIANELDIYETAVVSVLLQGRLKPTDSPDIIQHAVENWLRNTETRRKHLQHQLTPHSGNDLIAEALDAGVSIQEILQRTKKTMCDIDALSYGTE